MFQLSLTEVFSPACSDGLKVEAKTPDGTRVATPTQLMNSASGAESSSSQPSASSGQESSYASALKAKPSDWHLEFSMNGHPVPLDATIYGAVHKAETRNGVLNGIQQGLWSGVYAVTFKRVPGSAPVAGKKLSAARVWMNVCWF